MKKEIRDNQALNSSILFFDPVNKKRSLTPTLAPAKPGEPVKVATPPPYNFDPYENIPGVRTFDDGSVEVTMFAPDAKRVELAGTGGSMEGRYDMAPQGDGYWKVVVTDLVPGFHFIEFYVDGVLTFNPSIPIGYGYGHAMNYLEVPDPNEDFYLLKDVPHGDVRQVIFKSAMQGGRFRNCWVYTPPGYDENLDKRYPVMYIQHGGGENEMGWFWQGKLNFIADNLIAEGKAAEMIIVSSASYAPKEVEDGKYAEVDYHELVARELVPYIDKKFRTIADREHRAMAGLSMGGGYARKIAHGYTDVFAILGQFSCGGGFQVKGTFANGDYDFTELFSSPEHYNSIMKKTFVSCGTDDPRHLFTEPQVKAFAEKGYNIQYHAYPGYHEWDVWRFSARDFMSEIFK